MDMREIPKTSSLGSRLTCPSGWETAAALNEYLILYVISELQAFSSTGQPSDGM